MPPTNPWGKKKQQPSNALSPGLPGEKSGQANNTQKSQYEEIQEDELIALSSIYGEDFRQIEKSHVAWKVNTYILSILLQLLLKRTEI